MSTFDSGQNLQTQQSRPAYLMNESAFEAVSDIASSPELQLDVTEGLTGSQTEEDRRAALKPTALTTANRRQDYLDEIAANGFPSTQSAAYKIVKRAFDVLFAVGAIVLASPLGALVAAAIKVSSAGPVFFTQERIGLNGKIFRMLKFRTMRVADKSITDQAWSAATDPRRTAVGTWLRRTSIDELPQFINVLLGEMSIVGPRPERPYFVREFSSKIAHYNLRHTGQVGITGLAQIHGYRGDTCIETRVRYDLEYLEKWSLFLDLKIIALTIWGGFTSRHE